MILKAELVRNKLIDEQKSQLANLRDIPHLVIILVGNNPSSLTYVKHKKKFANQVGTKVTIEHLPQETTTYELITLINELNEDINVHGILVQLPLPKQIETAKIIQAISPLKDVDGFSNYNIGNLFLNNNNLNPCTVDGIIALLNYKYPSFEGLNITIVGSSNIVGKPLALRFINLGATVTICNSKTKDIKSYIAMSDIFISAIGKAKFFKKDYFENSENLTVIDVGINFDENQKLCGDVDFENVKPLVNTISPVPGGVGPMTVLMVNQNLINAYKLQKGE